MKKIFFLNSFSKDLKLPKFILNMRKFSPIFSKYFCGIIFQFSLPFSNNLNIHLTCKVFIYERVLLELLKCTVYQKPNYKNNKTELNQS